MIVMEVIWGLMAIPKQSEGELFHVWSFIDRNKTHHSGSNMGPPIQLPYDVFLVKCHIFYKQIPGAPFTNMD